MCPRGHRIRENESPCPQGGASRKRNLVYIVPLDPAYKAGLTGHLPVKERNEDDLCFWK
jgi:hypothetical protein